MNMAELPADLNRLALQLKSLHVSGKPLVLTNVHDAASALLVASLPETTAVATGSFAIAAVLGVMDEDDLTLQKNLVAIDNIRLGLNNAGKINTIPLTADLQDAYKDPAESVREVIKRGVVGANIEDVDASLRPPRLRSIHEACERIKAALRAASEAGDPDFVVNARTDVLGYGGTIDDAVERGKAYLEAGATTAFVWGVRKRVISGDEVADMAKKLHGRLAVLKADLSLTTLRNCGVSRVSTGPRLYLTAQVAMQNDTSAILGKSPP